MKRIDTRTSKHSTNPYSLLQLDTSIFTYAQHATLYFHKQGIVIV